MANQVEFKQLGYLKGHGDWVTTIITNQDPTLADLVISGSRDKSILVWKLFKQPDGDLAGQPRKQLKGHSHFVSDLVLSNDNKYLLSASWDKELRFWDLVNGTCTNRFVGNKKEIFTCAMSPDNRQILCGGAERKFKLYNVKAEEKLTQTNHFHSDWISSVRYSPIIKNIQPYFVTVGWDGWLKVWNQNFTIRFQFKAHDSQINSVAINPSGEYIATGGKDKKLYIWNITDLKKPAFEYDAGGIINQLAFHPQQNWIVAATENGIKVWQISQEEKAETKTPIVTLDHHTETSVAGGVKKIQKHGAVSVALDANGAKLYGGFTDGSILVWEVSTKN
ncbi:unnamed protein product (macronuclear) [Paramecium tetraurelia]|uniref:Chromosome undetermined scaffold_48, whole genome shotgun sequence n=1 Tax=Paramecium tetraurelia TaxID=5888 RepID=Q6PRD4_PARTE|nr:uncharacterized protein GSPATT00016207001 [Paramecium tetraurelia]AAS93869.1 G-protein beta subunit [Paramecium tetraurelia]CAK81381.1 unnamed protein product [Paramecium tetraurelia]|eukprot:XP_001448778.1 hypothetical protein (macronuclear) [Paramecium tetraurelia strain d4-2]